MAVTRWINVDSMSILRRYVEKNIDEFSRRFDVFFLCNFDRQKILAVSTYFFDVILMGKKSTPFRRTLFDIISMSEKSTLFRCIFFNVILMGKKSTSFLCTFFKIILIDERSRSFQCTSMQFWWCFWKKRIWWSFWYLFLIIFGFIKTENCLDVSFQCNFVLM